MSIINTFGYNQVQIEYNRNGGAYSLATREFFQQTGTSYITIVDVGPYAAQDSYAVRVRIGNGTVWTDWSPLFEDTVPCLPYGSLINTGCFIGCSTTSTFADGNCGTFQQFFEHSAACCTPFTDFNGQLLGPPYFWAQSVTVTNWAQIDDIDMFSVIVGGVQIFGFSSKTIPNAQNATIVSELLPESAPLVGVENVQWNVSLLVPGFAPNPIINTYYFS
jgi:hypothetical protein